MIGVLFAFVGADVLPRALAVFLVYRTNQALLAIQSESSAWL